jgi:hypothetical protein
MRWPPNWRHRRIEPQAGAAYSDANNRDDVELRFVVTMMCVPGQPMLTLVSEQELATRKHLRLPAQPGPESFGGE